MRTFISDFISTLTFRGQQKAYAVLEANRLEKAQVDLIARKLSAEGLYANVQMSKEEKSTLVKANPMNSSLRDFSVRMNDLYNTSAGVSSVLSSNIAILTSDIKVLNDELTALEKALSNYSFLLSNGGAYDYAYLESFNDTRNREDDFEFLIPDRGNLIFGQDEQALVVGDEGMLSLPQNVTRTFPMTGKLVETNCSAFVTSTNELANALNDQISTGWRMAVSSPTPITSTVPSFAKLYDGLNPEYPGAGAVLELVLASQAPCDNLKIAPFSDTPFEILQIEMYPSLADENHKVDLLEAPVILTSARTFFFQLQSVAKIKVYIRQFEYKRNGLQPIDSESIYRQVVEETTQPANPITTINTRVERKVKIQKTIRLSFISRLVQKYLIRGTVNVVKYLVSNPLTIFTPNWGSSKPELQKAISLHRNVRYRWYNQTIRATAIEALLRTKFSLEWLEAFFPRIIRYKKRTIISTTTTTTTTPPVAPVQPVTEIPNSVQHVPQEQFKYEYNFGIQSIRIGNAISSFKGVYVSKILPSDSDIGELKLKAADTQYIETPSDKHQPIVTSVEYSVTNQAKPDQESDWVPILPVGQDTVLAERFFLDATGKGYFRFPASFDHVKLYKNGYSVTDISVNQFYLQDNANQYVRGLQLPTGYATAQDIFTVDYVPIFDSTVVNFESAGYQIPPLISSYDNDGAGEGFVGTNGQLVIDLNFQPYINYDKVEIANYTSISGLVGYAPITVRLNDGTPAVNLTNYKGGDQAVLNPDSEHYTYIHNGTSLMFNRPINTSFRVFYQYLPSNIRFRVVLRSNTDEFVSPKVDFVQIKAKTRKPDAKRI